MAACILFAALRRVVAQGAVQHRAAVMFEASKPEVADVNAATHAAIGSVVPGILQSAVEAHSERVPLPAAKHTA
jgi:hypothetical protein